MKRPHLEQDTIITLASLVVLALLCLFPKGCHAAETVNPHADVEIVLTTAAELRIIVVDTTDKSLQCVTPVAGWDQRYEPKGTIYLRRRDEVEMIRDFIHQLRARGLLVDDGRALAPTEKGMSK